MLKHRDTEEYLNGGNLTLTMTETKYRPLESHVCTCMNKPIPGEFGSSLMAVFVFDLCPTMRERKGDGRNLIG